MVGSEGVYQSNFFRFFIQIHHGIFIEFRVFAGKKILGGGVWMTPPHKFDAPSIQNVALNASSWYLLRSVKYIEIGSCAKFVAGNPCRMHVSTPCHSRLVRKLASFKDMYGFDMLQ